MGSSRVCAVCKGSGTLWGTPKLVEEGGLAQIDKGPEADFNYRSFGLSVICWRCIGKGTVPDDRRDEGNA